MVSLTISLCIIYTIFLSAKIINEKCNRHSLPSVPETSVPKKRFSLNMKMRLNLKAIIRWEQIRQKSFSLMDYSDKDDIDALLYTTTICNNEDVIYAFDVFRGTLSNEKLVQEMILKLERETSVLSQFQREQEKQDIVNSNSLPEMISGIVSVLIISGLDAHYVLNEMEICDLPLYIEAYEKKRKEEMESARMWTYLTILPHIDARKMENGAKDLITFPWEEAEKQAEKEIKETEIERFELFMQKGKDLLNL
ncbi:hypothetical protein ACMSD6_19985 [Bacteroides thetaiotaomicron]|uniref:hypothetical protein n=1 Tax=Bacteroides thetaiotaomicron TaxID=818 RepID=UPI0039C32408